MLYALLITIIVLQLVLGYLAVSIIGGWIRESFVGLDDAITDLEARLTENVDLQREDAHRKAVSLLN
jgi:hypothetical protein